MDFNKYPTAQQSYSSPSSIFFTLQALKDGRLRPEELNPRIRQEVRKAVLFEMDKERIIREIIIANIVELRKSLSVQKAPDTAARYVAEEESRGMSLEERIGRKAALKDAIRKYGTDPSLATD